MCVVPIAQNTYIYPRAQTSGAPVAGGVAASCYCISFTRTDFVIPVPHSNSIQTINHSKVEENEKNFFLPIFIRKTLWVLFGWNTSGNYFTVLNAFLFVDIAFHRSQSVCSEMNVI